MNNKYLLTATPPVSVTFTLANTRSKAQSEVEGDETQIQEMLLLLFRNEKLVQIQPITTLQPVDGMANNYKFNVLVLSTSRPLRFVFFSQYGMAIFSTGRVNG